MTATVHYLPRARPVPGAAARPTEGSDWATEAHDVLDAVEQLLARGRTADVIAFCELAVAYLEANATEIEDPTPLVRLGRRLGDLQRQATVLGRARPAQPRPRPGVHHVSRHPSLG